MDFHVIMYTISAYVIAYFFLAIFVILVLATGHTTLNNCELPIYSWYYASAVFYSFSFLNTIILLFSVRNVVLNENTVVIRSLIIVFRAYPKNWLYLYLIGLETIHAALTIWGSYLNFSDEKKTIPCFDEITLLCSFMFILVVLGYIYVIRMIVTFFHFWLGYSIYTWLKRKIRFLRKNELHMKK